MLQLLSRFNLNYPVTTAPAVKMGLPPLKDRLTDWGWIGLHKLLDLTSQLIYISLPYLSHDPTVYVVDSGG